MSASFAVAFLPIVSPCFGDRDWLSDRMAVVRRITAGNVELELPLDVAQHAAGAKAKQVRPEPTVAKFLFHEGEPLKRLLRGANAAGGLEPDGHAGFLDVFADGANHD